MNGLNDDRHFMGTAGTHGQESKPRMPLSIKIVKQTSLGFYAGGLGDAPGFGNSLPWVLSKRK
jgi:hypothetical protein